MSSNNQHQIAVLLRASRELDIIGDVSAVVDSPGELVAWAGLLPSPTVIAWRAEETGHRHISLSATHRGAPIRGQVMITLDGDRHRGLWRRLLTLTDGGWGDLPPGTERVCNTSDLVNAWDPPDDDLDNPNIPHRLIPHSQIPHSHEEADMTSEIAEPDRQEQQQPVSQFEVGTDGVIQPSRAEADEADRIDQAAPVPVDDEDQPAGRA